MAREKKIMNIFESLILAGEKKEVITGKSTHLVASLVILTNNIVFSGSH